METPVIALGMLIVFVLLGMLAAAFGTDSRDGFTEEGHPGLTL